MLPEVYLLTLIQEGLQGEIGTEFLIVIILQTYLRRFHQKSEELQAMLKSQPLIAILCRFLPKKLLTMKNPLPNIR